ncbi:MAG: hypothetical protein M1817_002877 [Caeruleum heppii]|nr:MAG: hypothetical protein M1817_002877 [Caeruleum heppii]
MHNVAPVTDGGSDELETPRAMKNADYPSKGRLQEQEYIVRKWALLWRSMILSSIGKTLLPYFITQEAPLLEELDGHILSSALTRWAPRLPKLRSLELWRGAALADGAASIVANHCPNFEKLSIYEWLGKEADECLAELFLRLKAHSLQYFRIISSSDIGPQTCQALVHHAQSLCELRLSNLKLESLRALGMLKPCTAIKLLYLEDLLGFDLEATQNDVFLSLVAWLRSCKDLRSLTLINFMSGPAMLTPVLLENDIHLVKLGVTGYRLLHNEAFHRAVGDQKSLRSLQLKADGETDTPQDIDVLVESLSKLTEIGDLDLSDISDTFTNQNITDLARNLTKLEEFWTSGYAISDAIWEDIAQLRYLQSLTFTAWTRFTTDGLLSFISQLGSGNEGLSLSVLSADPDYNLTEEEQALIRNAIAAKVDAKAILTRYVSQDGVSYDSDHLNTSKLVKDQWLYHRAAREQQQDR